MADTRTVHDLIAEVVGNIEAARVVEAPFFHLEFDRVFPADIYEAMLDHMPSAADYRPLPGRNKGNIREDGTSTRVKIDLFPEYTRHLPRSKRAVWDLVGRALCSAECSTSCSLLMVVTWSGWNRFGRTIGRRVWCGRRRWVPGPGGW